MSTFLELVNDVCHRLNEVPLTSATFSGASGFHADVKAYVNSAINRINREEFEWPFNHTKQTEVVVVDQNVYTHPADAKSVAYDTFRIKGEDALNNNTTRLQVMDYEEWLQERGDEEFNPADYADVPQYVIRNRNLSFTLSPPPDQAYTLVYEYYKLPVDMVAWDEEPSIPDNFRWVILEGAMYHAYIFRGATEEAGAANQLFENGVKDMRKIFMNRTEYVRSTVIRS